MSYLVLARKYRPRHFGEMVGQEHVVQALTNALEQQRLHHAYLFTGTRGVGKTTISRILAKSLNCTGADGNGGITATPCGQCPACTAIDAGRFVDYTELDAASNRGVDEVQGLLEQAVYKPVQGRFKVFMIDEVHMLTNTAFNAMLKTLEEPPEYLKFVLATTDPQKVPVTVLSRCLQFNLRPMVPETIAAHLQQVLQAEQIAAEPNALYLLARGARGSMRDALSLTDQAIAFAGGQGVQEAAVRQMLGSVDSSHVLGLIDTLAQGDAARLMSGVQALQTQGLSAASTLEDMARILQRMAVQQAVPGMAVDETDPDAAEVARLAASMPADETQLLYSICVHGRDELGLAPDEYAGLSMVLLRLLAFKPPAEKKTLKTAASAQTASAPAPAAPTPSAAPAAAAPAPALATQTPATAAAPRPAPAAAPTSQAASFPIEKASPPAARPAPAAAVTAAASATAPGNTTPASPAAPTASAAAEPPPWEDLPGASAQATPAASTTSPAGTTPQAPAIQAVTATPVAADLVLPVRQQPEPQPPAQPRPAAPSQEDTAPGNNTRRLVPTELGDTWHALAQALCQTGGITALARELLLQSQLMQQPDAASGAAPTHWVLRVEQESLNHEPSRKKLEQALAAHTGQAVQLQIEYGRVFDCPALRLAEWRAQKQQQARQAFETHPFVQAMMRDFGARILPGSVGHADKPAKPAPTPTAHAAGHAR